MKNHLIKIDELRPIVEQINNRQITYSKAIELITEIAETRGQLLPIDIVINMLRRFKNHCEITGYPSKSFKHKVKKLLRNYL